MLKKTTKYFRKQFDNDSKDCLFRETRNPLKNFISHFISLIYHLSFSPSALQRLRCSSAWPPGRKRSHQYRRTSICPPTSPRRHPPTTICPRRKATNLRPATTCPLSVMETAVAVLVHPATATVLPCLRVNTVLPH